RSSRYFKIMLLDILLKSRLDKFRHRGESQRFEITQLFWEPNGHFVVIFHRLEFMDTVKCQTFVRQKTKSIEKIKKMSRNGSGTFNYFLNISTKIPRINIVSCSTVSRHCLYSLTLPA